jgi:hypothetical protein
MSHPHRHANLNPPGVFSSSFSREGTAAKSSWADGADPLIAECFGDGVRGSRLLSLLGSSETEVPFVGPMP